jgi:hypothetical protein
LENPSLTFTIKSENLLEGPGVSGNERFSLPASGVDGLQIWIHAPENPSALLEMHAAYPDFGFVLQSGTEERPGWMDLSNLQDVLEKLEETD